MPMATAAPARDAFLPPPVELIPRDQRPQGRSDLTVWCPTCLERVLERSDGCCVWCDTPLGEQDGEDNTLPLVGVASSPPVVQQATVTRLPRRRDRRHHHGKRYSDQQIIARIQLWAKLTGRPPSKADWTPAKLRRLAAKAKDVIEQYVRIVALYEAGDFPSETTVRERFGSLNDALVLAGYEPRATGRPAKPENEEAAAGRPRPKTGETALGNYFRSAQLAREEGGPALKLALYDLALSAIREADRIAGVEIPPDTPGFPQATRCSKSSDAASMSSS
jgi:hypothetical protein